ncbi:phospholipase [Roseibium aquae]|uniref:Phospholipase n=1 Tax=Roseibium aquae TaxID=1323746 RepID=A0A916TM77_9HYPH|nr:dienelactone hydrolase family protein [Roseibium aquae]GGB57802.1 phospholipase [Roseibium aquae]
MVLPTLDGPRLQPLSGQRARKLVVILHGYGADGADLIDLGRAWANALPEAAFAAPDAPASLPFDAVGGRQWFALTERDMRECCLGAESARPALDAFLDAELQRHGLTDSDLALVGFSQGAMMAFHAGLRRAIPPAALLGYSGLLPCPDQLDGINTTSPVLIVHGEDDEVVDCSHLSRSAEVLAMKGVAVESHMLDRLGHTIDERGMVLGGRFLTAHLT